MNRAQQLLILICAVISFGLGAALLILHVSNQNAENKLMDAQGKLAKIQEDLNRGEVSRRLVQNIVNDLSTMSASKAEVQSMLARYGITLRKNSQD
jgi:hypothetical protein